MRRFLFPQRSGRRRANVFARPDLTGGEYPLWQGGWMAAAWLRTLVAQSESEPRSQMSTSVGSDSIEFDVDVVVEDGETIAHVRGEIDIATCERLRDAIEPHLGPGQRVVLDLSGVHFMDSSCLTVFVQARTTLTTDGGSLILRNPSDAARRVLTVSGMDRLFDIESGL